MKIIKTARELRTLILAEVQDKAPCPHGIDVSIEPGSEPGSWVAYVIPPEHSQWSDCAKLIGRIAVRLQKEYALPVDMPVTLDTVRS